MKYELKDGDILLYTGYGTFGKLISLFTFSKYAHVGILYDSGKAKNVFEAQSVGFVSNDYGTDLDNLISDGTISVFRYPDLTKEELKQIKAYCVRSKGLPYDWGDIAKIATSRLTLGIMYNDSSNKLICSEAVARAYLAANIELVKRKKPDYVTPKDISKSKKLIKVY